MPRHKAVYLALTLVLVLSAICGCTAPGAVSPSATSAETPVASPAAVSTAQILRFNISADPPTLDPSRADVSVAFGILSILDHGLMRIKPDMTVETALAKSVDLSSDGTTYTFTLRDDIKYSDGQPVKASDFVYAFKRLLDPRIAPSYAQYLNGIKGAEAFASTDSSDTAKLSAMEQAVGVSAPDDKTFVVQLNAPDNSFLYVCAMSNTVPLRQDVIEKAGDKWTEPGTMVSTGPFMLKTWEHGSKIVLVPNPYYYGDKPYLQEIRISMIEDQKAELEAFKAGELDIVQQVPFADLPSVKADLELSQSLRQDTIFTSGYLGFDISKPPFDNQKVRQALSYAIDRQALVDVVFQGLHSPATSFIPPGLAAYDQDLGFKFDVAKAKQLLAEAGYPNGQGLGTVTLAYNSPPVPGHKPFMEFVQNQLKTNLGLDVKLEPIDPTVYYEQIAQDTPSMFRVGWSADFAHPKGFIDVAFRSNSGQNFTGFKNTDFDKLLDEAGATADPQKQEALYRQAQAILVDEAPAIFTHNYGRACLVKPWVQNLIVTKQDGDCVGIFFMEKTEIAPH